MIKKIFVTILFFLLFAKPSFAQISLTPNPNLDAILESVNKSVTGERVKNFESNIKINKDGSIDVTERIDYFFDSPKHGIFRNIPFTKRNEQNKRVDLTFEFKSIKDEKGNDYKYEKSEENEQWVLKIGDANKEIEGDHTYIISYSAKGAIGYFESHDELYWNTTGNEWQVPIQKTKTTISLPDKLNQDQIQIKCFTGPFGSTKSNCKYTTDGQNSTFKTTLFLNSYEGLTTVVGFPKNTVATLLPTEYVPFFERWYGKITLATIIVAGFFWYLILPIFIIYKWYRDGRDPYVGIAATASFDPPKGQNNKSLTPAETGSLLDESVETRDIFASIVNLAQRGYLTIEETAKKDFTLHLTNKSKKEDKLLPFEEKLINGIFKSGNDVRIKDTKLYTTIDEVKNALYKSMIDDRFFPKNPQTTRNMYYALGGISLFTLNFVGAFIAFLFGRNMPKKTLFGAEQAKVARGLKNFLTSQERQLNFQGDKQLLFERLLPFAVAFGVEKAWAKRFEDFDLKNPDWYSSYSGSHFNSSVFASSLNSSMNSFTSSATPPSSSSSGFSGGSSGGGGGGGGGGSW